MDDRTHVVIVAGGKSHVLLGDGWMHERQDDGSIKLAIYRGSGDDVKIVHRFDEWNTVDYSEEQEPAEFEPVAPALKPRSRTKAAPTPVVKAEPEPVATESIPLPSESGVSDSWASSEAPTEAPGTDVLY